MSKFDFAEIVKRFRNQEWDLDDFCANETFAYYVFNHEEGEDTPKQREAYFLELRNRILRLKNNVEL